ncbi:MAG: branched-chain amino acid ABC transporter permease [Candidatus Adiutricales bacterium]
MKRTPALLLFWGVTIIALFMVPEIFGVVVSDVFVGFGITALFAASLNLLVGYGLFSFGHALFFGAGAYATALGLIHIEGLTFLSSFFLGGLVSGLLALLVSPILVRVSQIYFTLLTIALNQFVYVSCLKFYEVTGGENGLGNYMIPPLDLPGISALDMVEKANFYYFSLVVITLSVWLMRFFTKTPFGSIMEAVRDNQMRVSFLGFQLSVTKTIIFAISGFFAGIAGSCFALWLNVVDPASTLHLVNISILTFLAILVGGLGTFIGPFIGVGLLVLFEELVLAYGQQAKLAIGLGTILFLLYAPKYSPLGIMGIYSKIKGRVVNKAES